MADYYPNQRKYKIQRGVQEGNTYTSSGRVINRMDYLIDGTTPFGETIGVNKHPVLNVQAHHGITEQRDYIIENGSYVTGSLLAGTDYTTHDGRWYQVGVSGSNEDIEFQTAQTGVYISGYWAEMGVGVQIPSASAIPADLRIYAGYCNETDGFGWMFHESGNYIFIRHSGTETLIGQNPNQPLTTLPAEEDNGWNFDRANGEGGRENPSGFELDPERGWMFQGRFLHYGMGSISFYINRLTDEGFPEKLKIHEYERYGEPVLDNPNLPITVEMRTGASYSAGVYEVNVGGRQMSVLGDYVPSFRFSHETKPSLTLDDNNWHPLVTAVPNTVKDGIQTYVDKITLSADNDIQWGVFLNPVFTGTQPTYVFPRANLDDINDGNGTAVKYSREDLPIAGGARLDGDIISAQSQGQGVVNFQLSDGLFLPVPRRRPVTLAVRRLDALSTVVFGSLTLREEF